MRRTSSTPAIVILTLLALAGLAVRTRTVQPAITSVNSPPASVAHAGAARDGQSGIRPAAWTLDALRASSAARRASFEENRGQHDPRVRFMTRGANFTLHLTGTEAVYVLPMPHDSSPASKQRMYALRMSLVGANHDARIAGEGTLVRRVNYFKGSDANKWVTDVPTFERVRSSDVYLGVDLVWYGNDEGTLEYDFEVGPGRDPNVIEVDFSGASKIEIADSGDLWIHTGAGVLTQARPFVYQEHNGSRREISSSYEMRGRNRVGFRLGPYDARQPLVIDPNLSQLAFSTYLGGAGSDVIYGLAVDSARNVYVNGRTSSTDFPTASGSFDVLYDGDNDVFVTKLDAAATTALYSTYLGGTGVDREGAIAVDGSGSAYVVGYTNSPDLPTTPGAFDRTFNGTVLDNAFVIKLAPDGASLVYATYLGGGDTFGTDVAVDTTGNAYVVGSTFSRGFPVTAGAFDTTHNGARDLFVTKLNRTGSGLLYSTFLGGDSSESGAVVALFGPNAVIAAQTNSSDFPTTSGAFDTNFNDNGALTDGIVAMLNSSGTGLVATFLGGGGGDDEPEDIAVGTDNFVYVAGNTRSVNFPTTAGSHDQTLNGGSDGFVAKLSLNLEGLVYSTLIGGSGGEEIGGLALEPRQCVAGVPCRPHRVFVTGATASADFPITPDALDSALTGPFFNADAFVALLNFTGSRVDYGTYFGGTEEEVALAAATDASGNVYIGGLVYLEDSDFPIAGDSVFQKVPGGGTADGFVSKLGDFVVSGRILNPAGAPMAGVTVTASQAFSATTQTDEQGFYFFNVSVTGSYRIVPSQPGTTFTPLFRQFFNPTSNRVANFTGQ